MNDEAFYNLSNLELDLPDSGVPNEDRNLAIARWPFASSLRQRFAVSGLPAALSDFRGACYPAI